jgi:hypothetical protein
MAVRYSGIGDQCPYDLVSRSIGGCPRFNARVVWDRPDGAIVTCTHVRGSIARHAPEEGTAATFYSRCVLRTADIQAERDYAVPLD